MGGRMKFVIKYIPFLLLFLLLFLPLVLLIFQWLTGKDGMQLFSFIDRAYLLLIVKSLLISGIVALLATIIGTVCAFLLYKFQLPFSGIYRLALLLPLFISPYIFAVAWKDGFLWLLGNSATIYSEAGVILVHTFVFFSAGDADYRNFFVPNPFWL